MKVQEILDNYLISLGCSIKKEYAYIPKRGYDYLKKEKENTLEIAGYKVKLNKRIRNSCELIKVSEIAKSNFSNVVLTGNLNSVCESLFNNSLIYFTDFLKYSLEVLNIKEDILQNLINQCESSLDDVDKEIKNVLTQNNIKIDEARKFNQNLKASMDAHATAKANTIEGGYVTFYDNRTWSGGNITGHVTLKKGMTNSELSNQISYNSSVVDKFQREDEEKLIKEAIGNLNNLKVTIANKFNEKLQEILCVKLDSIFDYDAIFKYGENIEEDPLIIENWIKAIPKFSENDFENFKEAINYYNIDIINELKLKVEQNIFDYFIKEEKYDYDEMDYKLYIYLTGSEFKNGSDIAIRIKNYLANLEFGSSKENKKLIATFDKKKILVNECKYLTKEEKETILQSYETFKETNNKNSKNKIINIILSIILVMTGIYALVTAWKYTILFGLYNNFIYLYGFGGILVALILGYTALTMKNNLFKKILQVLLSISFIVLPIVLNPSISEENAKRDGKYMIKLEVLDKTEIIFLKEGELIPLDKIEMEGYVFNGWTDGSHYVKEPLYVECDDKFIADIYDTNQRLSTVTFKFGNGQKNMVVKVPLNSVVPNPPTPEKKGYKFSGWYDENLYQMNYGKLKAKLENVTFRAEWEKAN